MSDRWPASIKIGPCRRSCLEGLLEMIGNENLGTEWGEESEPPQTEEDLMALAAENEGILLMVNVEASGGQFEELEGFLFHNEIPFDRQSCGYSEYVAEVVRFRPETGEIWSFVGDQDTFREYVPKEAIEKVIERMPQLSFAEIIEALRSIIGPSFPPIEPFRVLEG